jgi:hypothetical protein
MKCSSTSRLPRSFKNVKGEMKNEVFQFFSFSFLFSEYRGRKEGKTIKNDELAADQYFFWV